MSSSAKPGRHAAIALLSLLTLIIILSVAYPPAQWVPARQWGAALDAAGVPGILAFILLGTLATAAGLPRQLVAFIAGLAYGSLFGLVLSLLAALCGCYLTLSVSQRYLSGWVGGRYPSIIAQLDRLLRHDVFTKILILRLQPLGTNLLTNVCIGFTTVPTWVFLAASGLGYIPQMLVFTLLGDGVRVGSQTQLWLSAALMIVAIVLGLVLVQRHRLRQSDLT